MTELRVVIKHEPEFIIEDCCQLSEIDIPTAEHFTDSNHMHKQFMTDIGEETHQCKSCQKRFSKKSSWIQHMRVHTNESIYKGESFEKSTLDSHINVGPYECKICEKSFEQSMHICIPLDTHTAGERRANTCNVCQKSFNKLIALKSHMKTHTIDKRFQCNICKKPFNLLATLQSHMLTHNSSDLHNCNICQKSFLKLPALNKHIRGVHKAVKPHQCNICQKSFIRPSGLKRHMTAHTDDRPHHCKICQKSFKEACHLKRHLDDIHMSQRSYQCDICPKFYTRSCDFNKHKKVHETNVSVSANKRLSYGELVGILVSKMFKS